MTEREQAVALANKILDQPWHDPDADIAMLARQFLRSVELERASDTLREYNSGRAIIEDSAIVVRVPFDFLPQIVEGAWAARGVDIRMRITDVMMFGTELASSLNREEEDGTTLIHKMFDAAINDATENGADGIEEHPEQDA